MTHGSWTCWSAWSSCSADRRSRHRSCSNPTPQNEGQNCTGETTETSDCEDQDLEYLRSERVQYEICDFLSGTTSHCFELSIKGSLILMKNILFLTFFFFNRTMEPQCFDQALPASQKCGIPPALINGYILVRKKTNLNLLSIVEQKIVIV